jgi:type II secretory pathway component PulK
MRRGNEGFVLLSVLGVLTLLTLVAAGYARRAALERRAAVLAMSRSQAEMMARGAVYRGMAELRNRQALRDYFGGVDLVVTMPRLTGRREIARREGLYAIGGDSNAQRDYAGYEFTDAQGRISLNTSDAKLFENIEALDLRTRTRILRRREGGVADDERGEPYIAIEELLTVEGVDRNDWLGDDEEPGLREYFTVWGDGLININAASPGVLACVPELGDDVIAEILNYRAGPDNVLDTGDDREFVSLAQAAQELDLSGDDAATLEAYCMAESEFIIIEGSATLRQGAVRASCIATVYLLDNEVIPVDWRENTFGL